MKLKKRKSQGQSTKSLQTFDNPNKRHRKPNNKSGEQLRTKSGASFLDDLEVEDDDSSTIRLKLPLEHPLNDRMFDMLNEASALRKGLDGSKSYEDDDDDGDYDDDDPAAKEAFLAAYKQGEDPQKILDSWQESSNKKSHQQKQSPAFPDSPEQAPGVQNPSAAKPLGNGLLARLPSQPRDLVAQIVKPRFVTLSWVEPLQNAGEVVYYTVYYKMNHSER